MINYYMTNISVDELCIQAIMDLIDFYADDYQFDVADNCGYVYFKHMIDLQDFCDDVSEIKDIIQQLEFNVTNS